MLTGISIILWIVAVALILVRVERLLRALEKRSWRAALTEASMLALDLALSGLAALALSAVVPPSIGAAPGALAGIYISSRIVRIARSKTRPTT